MRKNEFTRIIDTFFEESTEADHEKYINSAIDSILITLEGLQNIFYSQGLTWSNILMRQRNISLSNNTSIEISNITVNNLYTDHHYLWLDLGSIHDNRLHGTGHQLLYIQQGIQRKTGTHTRCIFLSFLMHSYIFKTTISDIIF